MTKLYVGNLPFSLEEGPLKELFEEHGPVEEVYLPRDETGRSRGFAFVQMPDTDAQGAMETLNGREVSGRTLRVDVARPRAQRGPNRRAW